MATRKTHPVEADGKNAPDPPHESPESPDADADQPVATGNDAKAQAAERQRLNARARMAQFFPLKEDDP
jgi:hypothetical protein